MHSFTSIQTHSIKYQTHRYAHIHRPTQNDFVSHKRPTALKLSFLDYAGWDPQPPFTSAMTFSLPLTVPIPKLSRNNFTRLLFPSTTASNWKTINLLIQRQENNISAFTLIAFYDFTVLAYPAVKILYGINGR